MRKEKIACALRWATQICMAIGGIFVIMVCAVVFQGYQTSQDAREMVTRINQSRHSSDNSYRDSGISYDLEARSIKDDEWYRGAIPLEFGDTFEIRLRIASSDHEGIRIDDIQKLISFVMTDGLIPLDICGTIEPSGRSDVFYAPVGTYQFGQTDWLHGEAISSVKMYCEGHTADELLIVPPYGEVNIQLVVTLLAIALVLVAAAIITLFMSKK